MMNEFMNGQDGRDNDGYGYDMNPNGEPRRDYTVLPYDNERGYESQEHYDDTHNYNNAPNFNNTSDYGRHQDYDRRPEFGGGQNYDKRLESDRGSEFDRRSEFDREPGFDRKPDYGNRPDYNNRSDYNNRRDYGNPADYGKRPEQDHNSDYDEKASAYDNHEEPHRFNDIRDDRKPEQYNEARMEPKNGELKSSEKKPGDEPTGFLQKLKKNKIVALFAVLLIALIAIICYVSAKYTKNDTSSKVIVYYAGFDKPYFQYQRSNGKWGALPGEAMTASSEQPGFTHKIEVSLDGADFITACFNTFDGSKNDDNGGQYYKFTAGTYTVKDRVVTLVGAGVTVSSGDFSIKDFKASKKSPASVGDKIELAADASGGKTPYKFSFGLYDSKGTDKLIQDYSDGYKCEWTPDNKGTFTLYVKIKDSENNVLTKEIKDYVIAGLGIDSITPSTESPQKVGTKITLTTKIDNTIKAEGITCSYEISDGSKSTSLDASSEGVADWTPEKAGDYTIKAKVSDKDGHTAETSIKYKIEEEQVVAPPVNNNNNNNNKLIVYYNGYDNAYFHYQLGDGNWTQEPGALMNNVSDMPNYKHKIEIDMNGANGATGCFTDDNGNWDNKGGANYHFDGPGSYIVTDGNVSKVDGNQGNNVSGSEGDKITIYYKGIDKPYVHYGINGQWTKEPGIAMEKASFFVIGYDYKITITLNGASQLECLFTDGNGNWDKAENDANYVLKAGKTYKIKDHKVNEGIF